ncbi:hypothetical protein TRFO_33192 [Tritrichomonas foetus]|uniref:Peptidase M60 domain-containing protein n=1 Tax=Tritrichomonas foetus TaxID=1144522 RepID=A0A1J4JNC6_9EUKA|nr:hypothetical protein TRFO_33192 [Tritrichomonas foetus]|eukprot:OHT00202.1 hypothetical protein TRFO_33192 [Tritrichomonas foetus]
MLYLAVTDIPQDICGTVLKLKCQNVTPYTRFSTVDPNLFNSTKNSSVTWAEILSEKVIFTLRKEDMNRIPDIKKSIDFIDTLIIYMCDFMNTDIMRPIRIVFDVDDANEDNIEYYPITLEMEEIHRILCDQDEPSCELFDLIKKIANYSITDGYFDEQVEKAMAALIACEVFRRVYKDFDPYKASFFENPPIFQELWKIHTLINSNIVPEILKMANNVSTGTTEVPEDKWVDFLSKLCSIGNANFTKMFEKIRPVPINLNIEVSNLPIPEEIST